jgi:uncharacterized protein (DUF2252 family)
MVRANPVELADWQLHRDRKATARFGGLFEHKLERMSVSPLAYLRGAAPLFYRVLAESPELAEGPGGKGWLCGDAHLENFGAFRTAAKKSDEGDDAAVVFDINDFDEATIGPWRIDVLRLTTSLLLGGRELGANGRRSIELSHVLLENYVRQACHPSKMPPAPPPIAALLDKVKRRSHRVLLAERTEMIGDLRRFTRGARYDELPKKLARAARLAFASYAERLETAAPRECFEVLDVAFRIAGTGSLGSLRIAVLTRGKGGRDGAWLFDMKEEGRPSPSSFILEPRMKPAKRVLTAMRACLERPPRMIGATKLNGSSMFVRRLAPQEDKLSLGSIRDEHLEGLAGHLGALLGRAHRRGAIRMPSTAWSKNERLAVIERAVVIAAEHEGAYLAMSRGVGAS